jgi:hypothetical protein
VKARPHSHQPCAQRPGETSILVVLADHRGSLHEGPLKQGAAVVSSMWRKYNRRPGPLSSQSPAGPDPKLPTNTGRSHCATRWRSAPFSPAGMIEWSRHRVEGAFRQLHHRHVGVDELGFPDFGPSMRWVCLDADDPQLLDGLAAPAPIKNSAPPRASADTGNHAGVGRGRTPAKRWPLGHPKTAARRPGAGKSLRAACPIPQTALSTNTGLGDEIRSRPPLACVPWRAARIGKS